MTLGMKERIQIGLLFTAFTILGAVGRYRLGFPGLALIVVIIWCTVLFKRSDT